MKRSIFGAACDVRAIQSRSHYENISDRETLRSARVREFLPAQHDLDFISSNLVFA
jgi:hypothetical protein